MPEHKCKVKTPDSGKLHMPESPQQGTHGAVPAQLKHTTPEAFINPAPKAIILALVLLILGGYSQFMYGIADSFLGSSAKNSTPYTQIKHDDINTNARQGTPDTAQNSAGNAQATQNDGSAQAGGTANNAQTQAEKGLTDADLNAQKERLAKFERAPRLLSGQNFADENLEKLSLSRSSVSKAAFDNCSLQNANMYAMHFKDCTFRNSDLSLSQFREVIFENCNFENINLDEAFLFNVNFIDCGFTSSKTSDGFPQMRMALARLLNVSFENVRLNTMLLYAVSGQINFKNSDLSSLEIVSDANNKHYPALKGHIIQLSLALEGCTGGDFSFTLRNTNSHLKIDKCDFENAKMYGFSQAKIQNSRLSSMTSVEAKDWLMVTNSELCADLKSHKAIYLLDNAYFNERASSRVNAYIKDDDGLYNTTKIRAVGGAECHIIGGKDNAWLSTYGGKLYISNLKMRLAYFEIDNAHNGRSELNLKNVELNKAYIYNSLLDAAYWEDVNILHPIATRKTSVQKQLLISAVNVQTLQGKDWPEGAHWVDNKLFKLQETKPRNWPSPELPS